MAIYSIYLIHSGSLNRVAAKLESKIYFKFKIHCIILSYTIPIISVTIENYRYFKFGADNRDLIRRYAWISIHH
jgi:hypothetical protein